MKKLFFLLMALVLTVPLWASEHTVTINRGEGLYGGGSGVYYCVKDGIMMTFTSGLDNENYLVEHQQVNFEINSYNYIIKKIVFHCVDSTTNKNMDCFYWGPTTISIVQNFYNQSAPGTLTTTDYTCTWTGESNHMQFTTEGKPVRFGSVEIIYDKLDGDIFDLVTSTSQIQEGKTYILVTQNDERVMRIKMTDDATFPSTPIVEWMGPEGNEKSKVKVDGNALLFRMDGVKDTTVTNFSNPKAAWFNTLNGYIRTATNSSGGSTTNMTLTTSLTNYNRAHFYIGTAYNFLARFNGNTSYYIRYDSSAKTFKGYNSINSANTRVWLYKLAEEYNVYTVCNPPSGGSITLGDGVAEGKSQQGETVHFTVNPADGYALNSLTVTTASGATIELTDNGDGTYSFIMPAEDVTITANFEIAGAYQIYTENTPAGGGVVVVEGDVTTVDNNHFANGGANVTVTPSPNWGWEATGLTVTKNDDGSEVTVTKNDNGSYNYTMPESDVTVHANYKRIVGDIFDLVTNNSQIVEGQTYIIVSQYYDKVMRYWTHGQTTFTSTDIVEWVTADKKKVRIDGNAVFFRMDNMNTDSTYSGGVTLRRPSWFNTMNGYLRTGDWNVYLSSPLAAENRGFQMVSSNAYNYLLKFIHDTSSGSNTNTNFVVRYNNADGNFNVLNWTNDTLTRVWLYKLAQSYLITTVCTPPEGGSITFNGGVDENDMAQGGETVTFTVTANSGYKFDGVTVTYSDGTTGTIDYTDNGDGTYSFIMPDAAVTIEATFSEVSLYLLGTAMGRTNWCASGPRFNYDEAADEYYLDVYFTGTNDDSNAEGYGYFSLAKHVDTTFDWTNRNHTGGDWSQVYNRLAAQYNNYAVGDGSTGVALYGDRADNAFKITAGIYRIIVSGDLSTMRIEQTPVTLTIDPESGEYGAGTQVTLSSDIQTLVQAIADNYGITEDAQTIRYRLNDGDLTVGDNLTLTQNGTNTVYGRSNVGYIVAENTAVYTIVAPGELYLLGWHNGATTFRLNGTAMEYDADNRYYSITVYYKGNPTGDASDLTDGYFHFSTIEDNTANTEEVRSHYLIADYNDMPVAWYLEGGEPTEHNLNPFVTNHGSNAWKIDPGIYTIYVSADKSKMWVLRHPQTLELTPQGGESAANPTYVTYGTVVTASSGLEDAIHAINENEDTEYRIRQNDGDWQDGTTTAITQEGVIQVTGRANVGYIVVGNSAWYAYTPLSYIEENDDPESSVVVCDNLVGVWEARGLLWAKDIGNRSIDKTYKNDDQIDYVKERLKARGQGNPYFQQRDWDQSNWVVLDFSELGDAARLHDVQELVGKQINALTVRGNYSNDVNYTIKVTQMPQAGEAVEGYPGYNGDYMEANEDVEYYNNHYITANFVKSNLNAPYGEGFTSAGTLPTGLNNVKLYFMNPKVREVVHVMGVWNGNDQFSVYARNNSNNAYDISGIINVDWTYNRTGQDTYGTAQDLKTDSAYVFHMAVERTSIEEYGHRRAAAAKGGEASPSFTGYPLDLPSGATPTAVAYIRADKAVESVTYYNVMGQASKSPFTGINIVVTRYSDGSSTATKTLH